MTNNEPINEESLFLFSNLIDIVGPIACALFVLMAVFFLVRRDFFGSIVCVIISIVVGLFSTSLYSDLFGKLNNVTETESTENLGANPAPVEEVLSAENPAPETNFDFVNNIDPFVLSSVFLGAIGFGVLAFAIYHGYQFSHRKVKRVKKRRAQEKVKLSALVRRRDMALASIAAATLQRGQWEMNPETVFNYPEFTNLTAEPISLLSKAQKVANIYKDEFEFAGDNFTDDMLTKLEEAAHMFDIRLEAAQDYAKSVGWGKISLEEKALLSRAQKLIKLAANEAVNDHERAAALKGLSGVVNRLRDEFGRTVNVDKLNAAIEATVSQRMLTT